jgi:hypothetical protein
MIKMLTATKKLIQSGLRTQIHDHVMWPVSFSAMKRIVKRPTKPIPPDFVVVFELSDIFILQDFLTVQ